MTSVKQPCVQCKEKHIKCDEERPKCRQCRAKALPCTRPAKRTVFKLGFTPSFSNDQKWVNSEAKHFRYHDRRQSSPGRRPTRSFLAAALETDGKSSLSPEPPSEKSTTDADSGHSINLSLSGGLGIDQPPIPQPDGPAVQAPYLPSIGQTIPGFYGPKGQPSSLTPPEVDAFTSGFQPYLPPLAPPAEIQSRCEPLDNVQEACLLRYWIEEISHWFDLCDDSRHFQLVVPAQARKYPHLLNAVFAVAARHLCRLPQFKTSRGILYHGQLLQALDEHSATEYMLECMPALRQFHDAPDDDYRESIFATAVILRQLEEIDQEDDQLQLAVQASGMSPGPLKQVNFLAIIDAVLRSAPAHSVFTRRSLMQAAYWMALRQEIYHSFTRMEAPQLMLATEFWHMASAANKSVMHLVQVARWKWGDRPVFEWSRLMEQQSHLESNVLAHIQPIYKKPADKAKGEIFPTIWYQSNIEVTSIQLSLLAKAVLVAENPQLKFPSAVASRSTWRRAEQDVRSLLLEQSGIALCHPASPPALVHAAFGIQTYGDLFTDQYERRAIRTVVERYRDAHAWPVQKLLDMFE